MEKDYYPPISAIVGVFIMQSLAYLMFLATLYSIFTFNLPAVLLLSSISTLQMLVRNRSQNYIQFINKYFKICEFYNIQRIYEEKISDGEKTLFCYHPHGIFAFGALLNGNHPKYPNQKLTHSTTISSNFALNVPILGLHFRLWGVAGADSSTIKSLMKKQKDISLVPGGYEQATITTPNQLRVFIKNRKGFIKYALRYGYTIRHVLVLNQHKAMWTFDRFIKLRLFLNKIKMPAVLFCSRLGPFLPTNVKATTIIGPAISPPQSWKQNSEPTSDQINQMHKKYIEQLLGLYEKHRSKNGNVEMKVY